MRLFAAVMPPPSVLDHLDAALSAAIGPLLDGRGVRVSERSNWHLTTAFFGQVPDGAVEDLAAALRDASADVAPFEVSLAGAGVFNHRVLWLGVGTGAERMRALMQTTCEAAADAGVQADRPERSRAHLTIARSRHADLLADGAAALAIYRGPVWRVEQMALVRSEPGKGRSGGSLYTQVDSFPFV